MFNINSNYIQAMRYTVFCIIYLFRNFKVFIVNVFADIFYIFFIYINIDIPYFYGFVI